MNKKGLTPIQIILGVLVLFVLIMIIAEITGMFDTPADAIFNSFSGFGRRGGP